MMARHPPCLSKWQPRDRGEKWLGKKTEGGGMGASVKVINTWLQTGANYGQSNLCCKRGSGENPSITGCQIEEQQETRRRFTTCDKTSIISPYGVYYSFIIDCKIRILAYYITADSLTIQKKKRMPFVFCEEL